MSKDMLPNVRESQMPMSWEDSPLSRPQLTIYLELSWAAGGDTYMWSLMLMLKRSFWLQTEMVKLIWGGTGLKQQQRVFCRAAAAAAELKNKTRAKQNFFNVNHQVEHEGVCIYRLDKLTFRWQKVIFIIAAASGGRCGNAIYEGNMGSVGGDYLISSYGPLPLPGRVWTCSKTAVRLPAGKVLNKILWDDD